jgi:hypothetical protein
MAFMLVHPKRGSVEFKPTGKPLAGSLALQPQEWGLRSYNVAVLLGNMKYW